MKSTYQIVRPVFTRIAGDNKGRFEVSFLHERFVDARTSAEALQVAKEMGSKHPIVGEYVE